MSPSIGSAPESESSHPTEAGPEDLTRSVRAGIAAFFGASAELADGAPKTRADYGRLIADLENRIVESLREADHPPPTLGAFTLEERIGRGGFAVVYRATHQRTGARAAVKIVPAGDAESRRRVRSEVESLARLRHPNIVRVIDTGEEAGFAWIATEYVDGMTLAEAIQRTQTPPESFQIADDLADRVRIGKSSPREEPATIRRAIGWFRDLALALDALHSTGLVHRDVKPANILLDRDWRPYLIDFGLSSSAETTVSGILAGTVPYMSPEQTLGGYLALTIRSDVYSLAATMHEVLTGERVTRGVRREAILHQIAFVPVAPPSATARAIPSSLDPIFARALAKDSNARYASARDLAEDLDRWLTNRPLVHVRESLGARARRAIRKHPVGTALLGAGAIALLTWTAFAVVGRERAYRGVLAAVRGAIEAGDPRKALSTLASNADAFGARDAFRHEYREAALVGGSAVVHDILSTQAFASAGLTNEPRHVAIAKEAAFHLEHAGIVEPNLVLAVALSKYLSNRPAEARATLVGAAAVVERSRPLTELCALVAIAENDMAAFDAAMKRLRAETPPEISSTEICLRTWRCLYCRRMPNFPQPTDAEMRELEADVARILKNRSDHALARTLLGLLKLERKDYHAARVEFDDLVKLHGGGGDRRANLLMYALTSVMAAGNVATDAEEECMTTAVRYAKDAIAMDPPLHDRFLEEIMRASLNARARWVVEALTGDWNRRPELTPTLLTFAAGTVQEAAYARTPRLIPMIGAAVDAGYGGRLTPHMTVDYLAIRALELWDLRERADAAIQAGRAAEAADLWVAARHCVAQTRTRIADLPYVMVAGDALVAALQADMEATPEKRAAARSEAVALLRNATSPGLLESASKGAPSPGAAEQIRALAQHCTTQLAMMEAGDER